MFQFNNNGKIEEYSLEQVKLAAEKAGLDFNAYTDKHNIKEKPGKTKPTTQKSAEPVDVSGQPEIRVPVGALNLDSNLVNTLLESPNNEVEKKFLNSVEDAHTPELNSYLDNLLKKYNAGFLRKGEINPGFNAVDSAIYKDRLDKVNKEYNNFYNNIAQKEYKALLNNKAKEFETFDPTSGLTIRQNFALGVAKTFESLFDVNEEGISKGPLLNAKDAFTAAKKLDAYSSAERNIEARKQRIMQQGQDEGWNDKVLQQQLNLFTDPSNSSGKKIANNEQEYKDFLKINKNKVALEMASKLLKSDQQFLQQAKEYGAGVEFLDENGNINLTGNKISRAVGEQATQLLFSAVTAPIAPGRATYMQEIGPMLTEALEQAAIKEFGKEAISEMDTAAKREKYVGLIEDGKLDLSKLETSAVFSGLLDTAGTVFQGIKIAKAGAPLLRNIFKRKFKETLKIAASKGTDIGQATVGETLTEIAQEGLNVMGVAETAGTKQNWAGKRFGEVGLQTLITTPLLVGGGRGVKSTVTQLKRAIQGAYDPNSLRAQIKERIKSVNKLQKTNEITTEQAAVEIDNLYATEDVISNSIFNKFETEAKEEMIDLLSKEKGIKRKIDKLKNTYDADSVFSAGETKALQEQLNKIEDKKRDVIGLQNYLVSAKVLGKHINNNPDEYNNFKVHSFDTNEELNDFAKRNNISKKQLEGINDKGSFGTIVDNQKVVLLSKENVKNADDFNRIVGGNVVHHELGHIIMSTLSDKDINDFIKNIREESDKLPDNSKLKEIFEKARKRVKKSYGNRSNRVKSEEILTSMSDFLRLLDEDILVDDASFLSKIFSNLAEKLNLATPDNIDFSGLAEPGQALQFFKKYNSFLGNSKTFFKGASKAVEAGAQRTEAMPPEDFKESKLVGADIQKIYDEQGIAGAMDIIDAYKPLTTKLTNKYRDVPGFDFELLQSEIEIGKRGLYDLIESYTPNRGATLNTYIQGQLQKRSIEAANRILDTEFTLDVTEAKGVTDTTTEEVTERVEEARPTERVSLRKQLGLDKTIKPTVVNAVKKTFGTRLPEVTSPKFKPELEKRFRTELKKPIAKLMGRTEDYRSFLSNNFEVLYDVLPQSVINRRFNEFAEPVLGIDGKPLREKTAVGKGIFKKKKIVKAEWIKYFLGDNVGRSTQGTRKTALAEALAEQFAFDATMEVLADPQVMGKVKEIGELIKQPVPENMVEQVSNILDRPEQFKFSMRLESFEGFEKSESPLDRFFRIVEKKDRKGNEKILNAFLRKHGFDDGLYDLNTKDGIQEFYDDFIKYILPNVPKGVLFQNDPSSAATSNIFNRSGASFREIGFSKTEKKDGTRERVGAFYQKIIKKLYDFDNFGADIDGITNYKQYHPKATFGSTEEQIAKNHNNKQKVKEFNDRNGKIHEVVWKNLAKAIENDVTEEGGNRGRALRAVAMLMQFSTNNMTHFHKMGAEYIGYSMNAKGAGKKLYEWEHAMPSLGAAMYLMDSAFDKSRNFDTDYKAVMSNYKLIALDNAANVKLNSTYLKDQMPVGWKVFSGSYLQRYFNSMLFKIDGGIDPSSIMLTNGKTIKQQFRIEADGKIYDVKPEPEVKESRPLDTEFNQLLQATTGVEYYKEFSPAKARLIGRGKGKRKFFIPYSADDFVGLLYATLGEGKVGNKQMAWYEENLLRPFSRGIQQYEVAKQKAMREWMALSSQIKKDVPGGLNKRNDTGFRNQDSLRMYIWAKQGMDVPGAAKSDVSDAVALVSNNSKLKEFAERLIALNPEGYPAPGQSWDAGDITTDIVSYVNDVRRGEFLTEWKQNVDQIFTDKNKQKLLASYGQNYIDALEDILHRMKTGRNRKFGVTKAERAFMDWTNNSVGAIMFFNARSAVLQTLSAVNFINFSDNNPINAGLAFANQPQYWKDFSTLFNSDFLKQRRSGLQTDVNADEIANAAKSSSNKAKAALSAILKLGFTPTQIADSFAIASGGATFYRNRVKKYIKEGLDKEAAEKKAFTDFQEVAEETQQSARPDRISSQQASSLGRLVLAFGNTPMQYARLTKKASLDLINGRGDWKTNISKIAYYSVIQNIIFSSLQQGLFALLFDEEDDEKEKSRYFRIGNSSFDTLLRGAGVYGAAAATVKNMVLEIIEQSEKSRPDYTKVAMEATALSPPINSKLRKLESAGKTFTYKQSKEKVFTEGFSFENPGFLAAGKTISALTNLPADRVVQKADHIHTAMQDETELWQAIALSLGWSEWDLNMIDKQTKSSATPTRSRKRTRTRNRTRNRKRN
tara:strand:- start:7917 stop:14732 length:6816 start_codon:yes stop_codon:yes gene_type:complete